MGNGPGKHGGARRSGGARRPEGRRASYESQGSGAPEAQAPSLRRSWVGSLPDVEGRRESRRATYAARGDGASARSVGAGSDASLASEPTAAARRASYAASRGDGSHDDSLGTEPTDPYLREQLSLKESKSLPATIHGWPGRGGGARARQLRRTSSS